MLPRTELFVNDARSVRSFPIGEEYLEFVYRRAG